MSDSTQDKKAAKEAPAAAPAFETQVLGQYIKDLSFESPNVGKLLAGPGESPKLQVEVNVHAQRLNDDVYESAIDFRAKAHNAAGVIYNLEVLYGGLFRLKNLPEQAMEPFLLINCPTLLFPFLRRLAADITREGGFPPLMLDPIDFAGLYVRRQQELAQREAAGHPKN